MLPEKEEKINMSNISNLSTPRNQNKINFLTLFHLIKSILYNTRIVYVIIIIWQPRKIAFKFLHHSNN